MKIRLGIGIMRSGARAGRKGKRPRTQAVTPFQFRDTRLGCGLSVESAADLLRVTDRTIRNWESGASRCPYAAFKLMRIIRSGKVLTPAFGAAYVVGDVLITAEGHRFHAGDLAWWSLVVRQAQLWRDQHAQVNGRSISSLCTSMASHCNAPKGLVRSKRAPQPMQGKGKRQSGPILTPELGPFHRSHRATHDHRRAARPVGPCSNTGQNPAQITPRQAQ